MKKMTIFLMLFCAGIVFQTNAQVKQDSTKEVVEVIVYNAKDKVMDNVLASTTSAPLYRMTDAKGVLQAYPKENDVIYITSGNYQGTVPYTGQQKIELVFDKTHLSDKNTPSKTYAVTKLPKFNLRKIYTNPNIESYGSLIWILQQKFPSVLLIQERSGVFQAYLSDAHTGKDMVKPSSWELQSRASFTDSHALGLTKPNTAKVYVDEKLYPNIHKASNDVKLTELVSIRIEKPDSFAGRTGTGAIYITTLKGGN